MINKPKVIEIQTFLNLNRRGDNIFAGREADLCGADRMHCNVRLIPLFGTFVLAY